jgi:hypothetical protein
MYEAGTELEVISAGTGARHLDGLRVRVVLEVAEGNEIHGVLADVSNQADTFLVEVLEDVFNEYDEFVEEPFTLWRVYAPGIEGARYRVLQKNDLTKGELVRHLDSILIAFDMFDMVLPDVTPSQKESMMETITALKEKASEYVERRSSSSIREMMKEEDPEIRYRINRINRASF